MLGAGCQSQPNRVLKATFLAGCVQGASHRAPRGTRAGWALQRSAQGSQGHRAATVSGGGGRAQRLSVSTGKPIPKGGSSSCSWRVPEHGVGQMEKS